MPIHWSLISIPYPYRKLTLCQQLSPTSISPARRKSSRLSSLFMLGLYLACACTGLVFAITTSLSVKLPCCFRKTLFPCSQLPSLAFTAFHLFVCSFVLLLFLWFFTYSSTMITSLGWRRCNMDVSFRGLITLYSTYSLHLE